MYLLSDNASIETSIPREEVTILQIDLNAKYVVYLPGNTTPAQARHIQSELKRWIASDEPFLLVSDDVTLVKIETVERPV